MNLFKLFLRCFVTVVRKITHTEEVWVDCMEGWCQWRGFENPRQIDQQRKTSGNKGTAEAWDAPLNVFPPHCCFAGTGSHTVSPPSFPRWGTGLMPCSLLMLLSSPWSPIQSPTHLTGCKVSVERWLVEPWEGWTLLPFRILGFKLLQFMLKSHHRDCPLPWYLEGPPG